MSDYLPDELVIKILERLPVKSLIICSFVCKCWYSIIRNPSFITHHLKRVNSPDQIVKKEKVFFTSSVSRGREIGFYSLTADNAFHNHLKLDSSALYKAELVGCCSGLVCLVLISNEDSEVDRVVIWNPSIRKSVSIQSRFCSRQRRMLYGFFVHPTTHQYKVAAFPCRNYVLGAPYHVEIYRQHIGAWSVINSFVPYCVSLSGARHLNGVVHWIANGGDYTYTTGSLASKCQNLILLFNMHTEAFSDMAVPPSVVHTSLLFFGLAFSLESLVLYNESREHSIPSRCSTLWIMKEYGVAESWTKLFSIEVPGEWHTPLGFRMNGKFLLTTYGGTYGGKSLVCYDPLTNITTTIASDVIAHSPADTYVESLLLLNVDGASEHESFGEFQSDN